MNSVSDNLRKRKTLYVWKIY